MPSLTPKEINGHTYYYARYSQRVDGKPKVVRTVYLGNIEALVAAAQQSRQPSQRVWGICRAPCRSSRRIRHLSGID